MIPTLYRFRYFGAYLATLAVTLHGLLSERLASNDFAIVVTGAFAVLCGAGASTRFAKPKTSTAGASDA
jgi:hypothetical protein